MGVGDGLNLSDLRNWKTMYHNNKNLRPRSKNFSLVPTALTSVSCNLLRCAVCCLTESHGSILQKYNKTS